MPINPRKLLRSKWTAVQPMNKEKHFVITDVEFDDTDSIISCVIQAVFSRREILIDWQELNDERKWVIGWK